MRCKYRTVSNNLDNNAVMKSHVLNNQSEKQTKKCVTVQIFTYYTVLNLKNTISIECYRQDSVPKNHYCQRNQRNRTIVLNPNIVQVPTQKEPPNSLPTWARPSSKELDTLPVVHIYELRLALRLQRLQGAHQEPLLQPMEFFTFSVIPI